LKDSGGEAVYVGRTNNFAKRRTAHASDPIKGQYDFEIRYRTDDYAQQRGLEQHLYDKHKGPPLNKIRPISPRNKNLSRYLNAKEEYLSSIGEYP